MGFYERVEFLPDTSVGYLVKRLQQMQAAALEPVFAAHGLTMAQWSALVSIYFARATTCADLARDLAHDTGAMTRMIDQLETRGLVARERAAADRRVINLALTAEGRAMAERCRNAVARCWDGWLDGWSDEEVHALLGGLRRLSAVVAAAPACEVAA